VCNIFQFYRRVALKLTADLKVPFALNAEMVRQEDTVVHQAVREALANCLIHADYRGQGGVIVEKYRDRFEFSDPGMLLLDVEQIMRGGVSECRNRLLQNMFALLGYGEKAGSGYDKIRQGWRSQNWRLPSIGETVRPDRVQVVLSMVGLLPDESVQRLQRALGNQWQTLQPVEIQALVTADVEKRVTNARLREMCEEHPSDLTKTLQGLVGRGFLEQVGQKRWTSYRLGSVVVGAIATSSPHNVQDSPHKPEDSTHKTPETDPTLLAIADPARKKKRLSPELTREIVLRLCEGRYLTTQQIAALINRYAERVQDRVIAPLVRAGLLEMRFPDEPNRPDQAYTRKKTP